MLTLKELDVEKLAKGINGIAGLKHQPVVVSYLKDKTVFSVIQSDAYGDFSMVIFGVTEDKTGLNEVYKYGKLDKASKFTKTIELVDTPTLPLTIPTIKTDVSYAGELIACERGLIQMSFDKVTEVYIPGLSKELLMFPAAPSIKLISKIKKPKDQMSISVENNKLVVASRLGYIISSQVDKAKQPSYFTDGTVATSVVPLLTASEETTELNLPGKPVGLDIIHKNTVVRDYQVQSYHH